MRERGAVRRCAVLRIRLGRYAGVDGEGAVWAGGVREPLPQSIASGQADSLRLSLLVSVIFFWA